MSCHNFPLIPLFLSTTEALCKHHPAASHSLYRFDTVLCDILQDMFAHISHSNPICMLLFICTDWVASCQILAAHFNKSSTVSRPMSDLTACCCHGISFYQRDAVCSKLRPGYLRLQFLLCQLKIKSIDIFNL